jgi:hypothetical protein
MNRKRAAELLPIIQAFAEGKEIEMRIKDDHPAPQKWTTNVEDTVFPDDFEYRIKPEPFECWVLAFEDDSHKIENRIHDYFNSEIEAKDHLSIATGRVIHMREVEK